MKAAERLAEKLGANIDESMGAARPGRAGGSFPGVVHSGPGAGPSSAVHGGPGVNPGMVHGGPEKFQGSSRIKDALAIELDRIIPDPDQPRKEFEPEALESLASSLKERGQLQPIRVRWESGAGRWVIISGERRWRAATMAGLATISCVEAKGEMTPADILEDQLVENCIREDLKPIEQAKAFRALLDIRGCSARHLADSLRISHQSVGRALSLLTLPTELQRQVEAGLVPPSAAAEVAKVKDDSARREITDKIAAGELTRDETVQAVRRAESRSTVKRAPLGKGRGGKPKLPTERTMRTTVGLKVTVEGRKGIEPATMLAALREVAAKVESELANDQAAA